jgi:beta-galactosidase/beta-glucuronidase
MKKEALTTSYSEEMDVKNPWNEYPRPSFVRDSFLSLNGEWDFAYSKNEPKTYKEKVLVPFPPESRLSGINRGHTDDEALYYKRTFSLPDGFKKARTLLHFGAVDQICEVFLNGKRLGAHEGGYIPFYFDVTDSLKDSENELKVIVKDTLSKLYPYGKQKKNRGGMWYTPVSGIWQTVWLESMPEKAIKAIKITPSLTNAKISVTSDAEEITLTLKESGETFRAQNGTITVIPKNPVLWTPEKPHLYYFTLETDTDKIESYFALREIGTKKVGDITRLTLNGKPYLFNGLLDQGYFPDGIFLPATSEGYRNDILTAKALGFNMLRKHIKIEPQIFYYLCDKLGMIVFQDMINNSSYSFIRDTALPTIGMKRLSDKHLHKNPVSRKIFKQQMKETISLLYNHPSIVYYTIFNEGWGQFTADEIYRDAKAQDGTRIYDATSGWFWQKESDVDSHHIYFKKLKLKINPNRPAVISEFGGYSHRCEGHLFGEKNYGYKSFDSVEEFENSIASLYENEALPLVKNGVSALIYTQISDVEDETNGFLTYDRRIVKTDVKRFSDIAKKLYLAMEDTQ